MDGRNCRRVRRPERARCRVYLDRRNGGRLGGSRQLAVEHLDKQLPRLAGHGQRQRQLPCRNRRDRPRPRLLSGPTRPQHDWLDRHARRRDRGRGLQLWRRLRRQDERHDVLLRESTHFRTGHLGLQHRRAVGLECRPSHRGGDDRLARRQQGGNPRHQQLLHRGEWRRAELHLPAAAAVLRRRASHRRRRLPSRIGRSRHAGGRRRPAESPHSRRGRTARVEERSLRRPRRTVRPQV